MPDKPELGQIAYDTYCEATANKGLWPDWEHLDADTQLAWQLAAKAAANYTNQ